MHRYSRSSFFLGQRMGAPYGLSDTQILFSFKRYIICFLISAISVWSKGYILYCRGGMEESFNQIWCSKCYSTGLWIGKVGSPSTYRYYLFKVANYFSDPSLSIFSSSPVLPEAPIAWQWVKNSWPPYRIPA